MWLHDRIDTQVRTIILFALAILVMGILIFFILRNLHRLRNAQRLLISKNEELMRSDERLRMSFGTEPLKEEVHDPTAHAKGAPNDSIKNPEAGSPQESDTSRNTFQQDLSNVESKSTATFSDTENPSKEENKTERSDRSPALLSPSQTRTLLEKISQVMSDTVVISRSDFSLNMLAERVGSNTKYVSHVINHSYGKSFKDFLNEYRIREACRRLSDEEHYGNLTIQAIYQGLGYNSPGGFIEAFKKVNGMTPSVYMKLSRQKKSRNPT